MLKEEQTTVWEMLIQLFSRIKMDNLSFMTKQQMCI